MIKTANASLKTTILGLSPVHYWPLTSSEISGSTATIIDTAPTTARYAVFYQRLTAIDGRLRVDYQTHHGESGQTAKPEPPKTWEVEL